MQQILKRLEIIKSSIALEDAEIIELQISKLELLSIDNEVTNILTTLLNNDYATAVFLIENYLVKYRAVVVYEDKEIGALKMELKALEQKLQELSEEKNEYINLLNDFNVQYNLHLGDIIRKILSLKQEILYRKTMVKHKIVENAKVEFDVAQEVIGDIKEQLLNLKKELDEMDALDEAYDELLEKFKSLKDEYKQKNEEFNVLRDKLDTLEKEYEEDPDVKSYREAQNDYEQFSDEYKEIMQEIRHDLSEEQLIELKRAYRKASKLCHPDVVEDDLKEQALIQMQELNEAYRQKDLQKVIEILTMLENGEGFEVASDKINDKEALRAKIDEIRTRIDDVINEIDEIKNDEAFQTIQGTEDWKKYFSGLKAKFFEEQQSLEQQLNMLEAEDKKSPKKQTSF